MISTGTLDGCASWIFTVFLLTLQFRDWLALCQNKAVHSDTNLNCLKNKKSNLLIATVLGGNLGRRENMTRMWTPVNDGTCETVKGGQSVQERIGRKEFYQVLIITALK